MNSGWSWSDSEILEENRLPNDSYRSFSWSYHPLVSSTEYADKYWYFLGVNLTQQFKTIGTTLTNKIFPPVSSQYFPHYILGLPDTLGGS